MVSFSVLRMLIWFLSIGEPFFCHDTFALGLPCKKLGNNLYMLFREKRALATEEIVLKEAFLNHTEFQMQSH